MPAVATTANTPSVSAARSASPRSRPSASAGTGSTCASMIRAEARTEAWTSSLQATWVAASPRARARSRAAWRAERLPLVPPWTKQPPAPAGRPASSATQRSASFSACTAPAPSIHEPP